MKKLLALLLLGMLLFNWVGFEVIVALRTYAINQNTQLAINAGNYDRNTLMEIRVEMNLPYASDWTEFEKISGSFMQDGIVYNFVERKFEKGYMIFRCLPNEESTILSHAKNQYIAQTQDFEKPGNNEGAAKKLSAKKLNIETPVPGFAEKNPELAVIASLTHNTYTIAIKDGFGFLPSEPPEA